jgi:AcrR family transcriptional regulator
MARVTRAEAKARTRQQLLAAAGDVFAERGFNGATVEEIADRAGFTRGAFYANFTDKADAFLTLIEETRRGEMATGAALMASTPDDQKLGALAGWYAALADTRWGLAFSELSPQAARDPAIRARLAARQAEMRAAITGMLDAYLETEPTPLAQPAEVVATMILAIGDGVARQLEVDPDAVPNDLFTTTIAYLWFGLTGTTAPASET